jgi:hypothetical protein
MTRDQTLQIYQQAVSAYGADQAPAEAGAAMDLANVVGDAEYAKEALGLADEFGMSTKDFAGLLVGAAAVSKKDEDTFVKAARDLATFNIKGKYDPVAGFAAMTAMSGKFGKDELGTFTQNAGLAITAPNTLTDKIKNFDDMTAEQRLTAIRDTVTSKYGDTSVGSLERSGITDLRQQRALEAIFSQWDIFQQVMKEGPTYKDTYDPGKRLADLEMSDPGVRQEMFRRRNLARTEISQTTGAAGEEAYNQQLRDQYEASRLNYNPLLVNEQGAPRALVRKAIDIGGWLQNSSPTTAQLEEGVYREQDKWRQEQIDALNQNTEATKEVATALKETKTEKKETRNRNANSEP